MLLRLDRHCESPKGTKQSVYFNTKPLFIIFLFFLLSLTPFTNLHPQTLQPNPDSIPFAPAVNYLVGDGPVSVFCADLDGDTDLDLAVANWYNDNISILKNNGNGTFQTRVDYSAGNFPYTVFCADLDGDLDFDLAVANLNSNNVFILMNNGDGTFQPKVDYQVRYDSYSVVPSSPNALFCADLDGDSDMDLAVTNGVSSTVSILKNNGDATFQPKVDYSTGYIPRFVFCADLNADSAAELVVANRGDNTVSVLINNGDGTFQPRVDYATGTGPVSVFCADLDGDIDLDLAVANLDYGANSVSILKNNGDGTFQPRVDYATGTGPVSVFCADLDGDIDIDLAVANQLIKNVSILKNNGNGTFQTKVDYGSGDGPYSVFCADLDGDGDLDLAVANFSSSNISILFNLTIQRLSSYSLQYPLDIDSVKTPIAFKWQRSIDSDPNDTVRYDLYLSRSIVFNPDSTIIIDSLSDTTYTDSLDIKTWYWKVKAYDKWGAVRWSDQTWSFYVYVCGDANGDGKINVADVVYAINYLFKGGPVMKPLVAGEVNCDGKVTVADVVYTINYLFKGGPKPCQNCP